MSAHLSLILFDLDGTLVDTVPDLGGAVNRLLLQAGRTALPLESYRPFVSQGARGLLFKGFGITPDDAEYPTLFEQFTQTYAQHICEASRLFDGIDAVLAHIETSGRRWGVITNKRTQFTQPLMQQLGLTPRTACLVSGDTVAEPKPSPLPMLHALSVCGGLAENTLYIGDDERDVIAGKAAGMKTAAITYGYTSADGPPPESWGADHLFHSPQEILAFLQAE